MHFFFFVSNKIKNKNRKQGILKFQYMNELKEFYYVTYYDFVYIFINKIMYIYV